jgi:hypothetical protein
VRSQFGESEKKRIEARIKSVRRRRKSKHRFIFGSEAYQKKQKLAQGSFVRISKQIQVYSRKTFSFLLIIIIEGLKSKINGESKKEFEKDSKKFGRNPRNVKCPRFTVYFINLSSNHHQ